MRSKVLISNLLFHRHYLYWSWSLKLLCRRGLFYCRSTFLHFPRMRVIKVDNDIYCKIIFVSTKNKLEIVVIFTLKNTVITVYRLRSMSTETIDNNWTRHGTKGCSSVSENKYQLLKLTLFHGFINCIEY